MGTKGSAEADKDGIVWMEKNKIILKNKRVSRFGQRVETNKDQEKNKFYLKNI